jgi:polar amino acid transport system substrate-binding protein
VRRSLLHRAAGRAARRPGHASRRLAAGTALVTAAGAALLLAGCGPATDETIAAPGSIAAPQDLANPGHLTVALPTALPPYGYRGKTGASEGFAVDLAAAMAERLGVRLQVVALDPQDLLAAGRGGGVDVVIGTTPLSDTTTPPPGFDLIPYLRGGSEFVVTQDSAFQPQQLRELCGRRAVIVAGTREQSAIDDAGALCGPAPPQVQALSSNDAAVSALQDRSAEVYVADSGTAAYDVARHPGLTTSGDVFDSTELALALRSDAATVREAITRAFYSVHSDGTYEVLCKKWGLTADSL